MSLARVLLSCVSESFLAVDFFQKYSAKGFFAYTVEPWRVQYTCDLPLVSAVDSFVSSTVHLQHSTTKKCHAHAHRICHTFLLVLVLFCYVMRNFIRFSGLRVMSSTLFVNVPPSICSSTCVLMLSVLLSYQSVFKFYASRLQWGVFIAHHALYDFKMPLIYARMRGGEYTRKEWILYNKDVE